MENKAQYQKVCQHCGKTFVALRRNVRFCSNDCIQKAYKADKRKQFLDEEKQRIDSQKRKALDSQEYLSISEAAFLLGVSRPTLYKDIKSGAVKAIRISSRVVRIKKSDIEKKTTAVKTNNEQVSVEHENKPRKQCLISVQEAVNKYELTKKWFYHKVADITPTIIKGKAYYDDNQLKIIFKDRLAVKNITEWYSIPKLVEQLGKSRKYIYEFASNHDVPRKKVGLNVLVSKTHWDKARGDDAQLLQEYYTIPQIIEKYGLTRLRIYNVVREHHIPKVKKLNNMYVHKKEIDTLYNKNI